MKHTFDPSILRKRDIRGIVGQTIRTSDALAVGKSFGTMVRRAGGSRVALGYDGRLSSRRLANAVSRGLRQTGCTVVEVGLGPTPMLCFAEAELMVDGGIEVTGSRGPAESNGFKLIHRHARLTGNEIRRLARIAAEGDWVTGEGDAVFYNVEYAYLERLIEGLTLRPHRIAWDAGNGAVGRIVEQLVERLPGEHHLLHTRIDGRFPHHAPDPTRANNLADLRRLVLAEGLEFGFAFDGDGDRLGAVDAQGRIIRGDQLLAIVAEPLLRAVPGAALIARSETRRVSSSALAGEAEGHMFFTDRWYGFDDALYAALRTIEALDHLGRPLATLTSARGHAAYAPELLVAPARPPVTVALCILRDAGAPLEAIGPGHRIAGSAH